MNKVFKAGLLGLALLAGNIVSAQTVTTALPFIVNNPIPTLSTLSPASGLVGSTSTTVLLNGTNFVTTSTATFNGVGHSFTFVSPTQGSIVLTTAELVSAGSFPVCVANPAPGGGTSGCLTFQVTTPLSLASLSPTSCVIYGTCTNLTLTANGTGFVSGAVIQWNGTVLTTAFVSATKLTAVIPASLVAGTYQISVMNPAVGAALHSVDLTATPSVTPSVVGYNVYRDSALISGQGIATTNFSDYGVLAGKTYRYTMRSYTGTGVESPDSSPVATATIPTP